MINLRTHNVIDYAIGIVLLICPWVFRFAEIPAARDVFVVLGAGLIVYSLLTNYYYALARWIPLGVHMTMDALAGAALILAPSLFAYRELLSTGQYAVHVILGLGAIGLVAVTRPRTEADKTPAERASIAHEPPPMGQS